MLNNKQRSKLFVVFFLVLIAFCIAGIFGVELYLLAGILVIAALFVLAFLLCVGWSIFL